MAHWEKFEMDAKITAILKEVAAGDDSDAGPGPAYVTVDQLAIELALRHPSVHDELKLTVEGFGKARHSPLADFLSTQLLDKIKRYGDVYPFEYALFAPARLGALNLKGPGVREVGVKSKKDIPLIRLRPKKKDS